jgi:hypothetical protein
LDTIRIYKTIRYNTFYSSVNSEMDLIRKPEKSEKGPTESTATENIITRNIFVIVWFQRKPLLTRRNTNATWNWIAYKKAVKFRDVL